MKPPSTKHDLYTDELLTDPYPVYEEFRELGHVVWMEAHQAYALPRFSSCRESLRNWSVFSSASGVMMNDPVNQMLGGNVMLCQDGETHSKVRSVVAAPLTPKAVSEVREQIETAANDLVAGLIAEGTFDAAGKFSHHLPTSIVSTLVGLPKAGRDRMVDWGNATFNTIGPMNARAMQSFQLVEEMGAYIANECTKEKLLPGSWSAKLIEAEARGDLPPGDGQMQINNYLGPALDTTINATSNMVWLFAQHPDQWELLRSQPDLAANAINEVLRYDAVIQGFSRMTTADHEIEGSTIPAHSRVLMLYGSANRDNDQFPNANTFSIERKNAGEHLSLGFGSHACPGGHLARLEMRALLDALIPQVKRFDLVSTTRKLNNVTRGLQTCVVDVVTA
jgi:cytochrome P450